ncbi:MAG: DHA2 family efflux MFS transporter permease subunit [Deltaproteobacteria bacterium]|jgi:DHA2 family multidrug resistance protein|nr:DHA2 family efflux MFS transporter permease subunit [Deltaproteobacteria bacterium]
MNSPPAQEYAPLTGWRLALLTTALPLATFMQVLDITIANVSIPTISGNLGASNSQGTWILTSYAVANAIALPVSGWLARRLGQVRLFLWSTGLFTLISLFCGLATNLGMLVVFRVLQGAAGGPMVPLAQSLLLTNCSRQRRNMAIALWAMTVAVAPIFGPILGGYISDNFYWGWIFFLNIPLGLVVLILTLRLLGGRETPKESAPVSLVGFGLLVLGVGAFQMMLDRGKELDWFNSPEIVTLAVIALVGISLLLVWEGTEKHPIIDLSLFASRNFSVGAALFSLGMMLYLGTVVLLPLLLQTQYGYTATLAGLITAPVGILPMLVAPVMGKLSLRMDLRLPICVGFLIFAGCMFARTYFSPQADAWFILLPQFIQGLALGCFFVPTTTLTLADIPRERMADASSLFNFLRTLCGAVGTSVTVTLWERRESLHHVRLTEHINPYNHLAAEALETLEKAGLSAEQAAAWLAGQITRQGFILAAAEIYQLCTFCFLGMALLIWLAKSTKPGTDSQGKK